MLIYKECEQCGQIVPFTRKTQRFCSMYCRQKWAYHNKSINGKETKICRVCMEPFDSSGSDFCSRRCYAIDRYKRNKKILDEYKNVVDMNKDV